MTTEKSKVNCIYSHKELRYSLEQMFNNEFTDTASTRRVMLEVDKEAQNYMTFSMVIIELPYHGE